MLKYLIPAVLLSTLMPAASPAEEITTTVHVAYRDLDLQTPEGVRLFDRRIDNAIATVCPASFGTDMERRRMVSRCRVAARANVAAQRATVLAKAERGNVQLAGNIVR